MRTGEVLETVPGVVISQHSGEGKANQVLPPRLQPRSRHRFRDDRRRHAGQHADARPRPWLLGSELPDSRAGQRRAVLEGPVLRRAGRLRHRGRRRTSTTEQPRPADRPGRRRRRGIRRARWSRRRRRSGAASCSPRFEVQHNDGPWDRARRLPQVQRRAPLQPRRCAERLRDHRHGLSRQWNSTDQVPSARSTAGRSTASARSTRPTAAIPTATAARSNGSARAATRARRSRPTDRLRPDLFSNFTYFLDDPGERRPVPAGRSPVRAGREGQPSANLDVGRPVVAEHIRLQLRNDNIDVGPLSHPRPRSCSAVREDDVLQTSVSATRRTRPNGPRGCGRWPVCGSTAIASAWTQGNR